ncbi:MAG: DUF3857 domain-containing protein [Sphingobacteriales bacterium]|nr:MAG: DUF3857 domain-containing protein [Sphingobacteriales bacterium]
MLKTSVYSAILFLLIAKSIVAQPVYSHQNYNWEELPVLYDLQDEESTEPAVIIKDKRIIEFCYDEPTGALLQYETVHKIVRVNDDAGVEGFNKVYVPMHNVIQFIELKARAITKDGKVVVLNKDNIKEIQDVEDYGSLKIFAIEGVEKGGEIEYFYTIQSLVTDPYGREIIQTDNKIKEASIDIISPDNLVFEAKSYNGFPELKLSELDSTRQLSAVAFNIPALFNEEYCTYRANLMKVDYKVSYNTGSPQQNRLYSWESATENFSDLLYSYTPEAKKMVQEELKKLKIKKLNTDQKVIRIEQFLKTTVSLEDGSGPEFNEIEKMLVNRFASELGIARLFAAFLKEAEIDHDLVITTNRNNARFDKDFESWNNFVEIIIYVNPTKKYIAPDMIQFRYGQPPYQFANNYGFFINQAKKTGVVKYIQMPDAEYSTNNIDATISFDQGFMPTVNIRHGWTGYRAAEYRVITLFQKEEFVKAIVLSGMEDAQRPKSEVFNDNLELSTQPEKEFYITSQFTAPSLIEKAGKNYLFKVGNIIGPQVELYQQHERQHDIDMDYPVYYRRKIKFSIPEGYKVSGLETANIDHFVEEKGIKTCRFVSGFQQNGREITITADEYYQNINLPKSEYEPFRKVINAAADFNKVVLVFEKD